MAMTKAPLKASHEWKWYILFLTCFITLGGYYSFDFPSALHGQLHRHFSSHDSSMTDKEFEYQFGLAYSVYSLPNIVLPWLGGVAIDRIGNGPVMIICGALIVLGNIIQTTACYTYQLQLFLLGRFIFGLGAETLTVSANTYVAKWFHGQELALALGINLSACKLGGVLTAWGSPYFARKYGVNTASFSVVTLCVISFVVSVVLYFQEPWYHPPHFEHGKEIESTKMDGSAMTKSGYQSVEMVDRSEHQLHHRRMHSGDEGGAVDDNSEKSCGQFNTTYQSELYQKDAHEGNQSNPLAGCYFGFNKSVWLVFLLTFIMYGTFIPFSNISNAVLLEVYFPSDVEPGSAEYMANEVKAAQLQSIPYFLTVFINPIFGCAIDWFGFRTYLLLFSTLCLVCAHGMIYSAAISAVIPLLMIGLSFSVFGSVIWPCIPLIVEEEHHGSAYGLMGAFQNAAQSLLPLVLSQVYHESGNYRDCEVVLALFASLGLIVGVYLLYIDEVYENAILRKP